MRALYLFSVWSHIVAATVWVGGAAFLGMVLVPAIRRIEDRGLAVMLIHWTGRRFRSVSWVCFGLLILTGAFNVFYRGFAWNDLTNPQFWRSPFGQVLGMKLLFVAAILLFSAFHDFVIGPRAASVLREDPDSSTAQRLRRQASWLGRLVLLMALVAIALGVMLTRGTP